MYNKEISVSLKLRNWKKEKLYYYIFLGISLPLTLLLTFGYSEVHTPGKIIWINFMHSYSFIHTMCGISWSCHSNRAFNPVHLSVRLARTLLNLLHTGSRTESVTWFWAEIFKQPCNIAWELRCVTAVMFVCIHPFRITENHRYESTHNSSSPY